MAQHAVKKQSKAFDPVSVTVVPDKKSASAEAFSRASHFGWALLPMWVGVTYLFVKHMVGLSQLAALSAQS